MAKKSFFPLFATNFFGVFNDNFMKTFAMFSVTGYFADEKMKSLCMGLAAGALVLPYVFCSPLADRLIQLHSKVKIVRAAKYAEFPIVAVAITGFLLQSIPLIIFAVFLMGLQSSLYSPAKYALVRDIGGYDRISTGMGGMDGVSFLAMLSGTVGASFLVDCAPFEASYATMILAAALGLGASYAVTAEEEKGNPDIPVNPWTFLRQSYKRAAEIRDLNLIIFFSGIFWWMAATMQMGLLLYGIAVLKITAFQTGLMLSLAAIGISVGNVLAGFADRKCYLAGLVPATGILCSVLLFWLYGGHLAPVPFSIVLFMLAFALGFFKLPLDAEIQKTVKGPALSTMLAYCNQVTFLFILFASFTYSVAGGMCGAAAFLPMAGSVFALASIGFFLNHCGSFCYIGRFFLHFRYKITVRGMECVRPDRGNLVMPNHVALVDPILIRGEFYRTRLRPLVDEAFFRQGFLAKYVLKMMDSIGVPDLSIRRKAGAAEAKALDAIVLDALARGENVLLYPSGHITADGAESIGNRQLAYNLCGALPPQARVLAVRTTGLWGSMWSKKGRKTTPPFVPTLLKAFVLWIVYALTLHRRREVRIEIEDVTEKVRAWSALSRREFNRELEAWYNQAE